MDAEVSRSSGRKILPGSFEQELRTPVNRRKPTRPGPLTRRWKSTPGAGRAGGGRSRSYTEQKKRPVEVIEAERSAGTYRWVLVHRQ